MVNPQDHEAMTHGEGPTLSKSAAEFNSANGAESAVRPPRKRDPGQELMMNAALDSRSRGNERSKHLAIGPKHSAAFHHVIKSVSGDRHRVEQRHVQFVVARHRRLPV